MTLLLLRLLLCWLAAVLPFPVPSPLPLAGLGLPEMSEPQGGPEIPDPQSWPNFDRVYPEPPVEEPLNGNLVDPDDIPVDDGVWEEFYALQVVLPKDPFKDWEQSALVGAETNAGTEQ